MINFKNIFSLHYHPKLLEILINLTLLGVFAANIMSPLLMAYVLYDVVPHFQIHIWLSLHISVFFGRIFIAKKLRYLLKIKSKNSTKYLKITFMLTTTTTILYGIAVWSSLFYGASDLHIFTIAVIIVSLSAGALATLISIYKLYALYVVFSMIPLIAMLLYHGGEMFNIFAFVLIIFTISTLSAGHRQYTALRNSISLEETFQTIYEKSSDGIALLQNNRMIDCNEAIVKMFQYNSKEELLDTHLLNFMPKRQADGTISVKKMLKMAKITMQNGTNSFEWLYKRTNGELFWTEVVLTKIYLDGEELIHGIWRDITDRKKLEEDKEVSNKKIEQLNQSLESRVKLEVDKNRKKDQLMLRQSRLAQMGEMLSMIAHQWRQPLAAISATSTTIELKASMNKLDNDDIQQKAHNISNYSQHLSRTIDDFRGFFKPNKEKTETTYDEIIDSIVSIMGASLKNKNIQLIKKLNCHETFSTYPGEIKQVILNLMSNAEEALLETAVEEPYIKIVTYIKEDKYILEVSDNAGGISEKIINYIFDPYFSTKEAKDGTGLGLYMSKMIIEDHCSGTLSVLNMDKGALFSIALNNTDQNKAIYDNLTGIYNRHKLNDLLQSNFSPMMETKAQSFAFILFDIDHFREINDTYGHLTGNQVLKQLTYTIKEYIRKSDIFVRWGGDEFILVIEDVTSEKAMKVAEDLCHIIEQSIFNKVGQLTCSFGVSLYQNGDTLSQMITRVDKAMYTAKNSGRNQVAYI